MKRERARELRAEAFTLVEIAEQLGVAKSTVSHWVRDVSFRARPRRPQVRHGWNNKLAVARRAEIERLRLEGHARIGQLTDREFLVAGLALYAGEGAKTDGAVKFANSDPRMIFFFVVWLRRFFEVDESRLRLRLYLHEGLDLEEANRFWSDLTGIPEAQFGKPYRAAPDPSIRRSKHPLGCPAISYSCSRTHRAIMGLSDALLTSTCFPG